MSTSGKPWWQQVTAMVTLTASGAVTGFSFVPGSAADLSSPTGVPVHLMALEHAARPAADDDVALRTAIVNVSHYYLRLAKGKSPAQMQAMIWQNESPGGTDHGATCAAFASLTLEMAAQAVGRRSWVSGGATYPYPLYDWADVRVEPNPSSPRVMSVLQDAQAHHRWHPLGDGYQPQPGDWVMFHGHIEVVTGDDGGLLRTIGGDSLPNFSVNAHEFSGPLASHGVIGFVNNGSLPPSAAANPGVTSARDQNRAPGSGGSATRAADGGSSVPGFEVLTATAKPHPKSAAQPPAAQHEKHAAAPGPARAASQPSGTSAAAAEVAIPGVAPASGQVNQPAADHTSTGEPDGHSGPPAGIVTLEIPGAQAPATSGELPGQEQLSFGEIADPPAQRTPVQPERHTQDFHGPSAAGPVAPRKSAPVPLTHTEPAAAGAAGTRPAAAQPPATPATQPSRETSSPPASGVTHVTTDPPSGTTRPPSAGPAPQPRTEAARSAGRATQQAVTSSADLPGYSAATAGQQDGPGGTANGGPDAATAAGTSQHRSQPGVGLASFREPSKRAAGGEAEVPGAVASAAPAPAGKGTFGALESHPASAAAAPEGAHHARQHDAAQIPGMAVLADSPSAAGAGRSRQPGALADLPGAGYQRHRPTTNPVPEPPAGASASQQAFIASIAPGALAAQSRYGVPAAVTIAQAIDESGWGQSSLSSQDHNLFGIKGTGPAGTTHLATTEYENGRPVGQIAGFRVYHSFAESIDDHGRLLSSSGYYTHAMSQRHDPDAFAHALTGVYATDPSYGSTLVGLMQRYDLYRYDVARPAAPSSGHQQNSHAPGQTSSAAPVGSPAPVHSPQPVHSPAPVHAPQPVHSPAPVDSPAPVSTPAPVNTPTPAQSPEPVHPPAPVSSAPPVQTAAPVQAPQPVHSSAPADSPQPVHSAEPVHSQEPVQAPAPVQTPTPADSPQPEHSPAPADSPAPVHAASPAPVRSAGTAHLHGQPPARADASIPGLASAEGPGTPASGQNPLPASPAPAAPSAPAPDRSGSPSTESHGAVPIAQATAGPGRAAPAISASRQADGGAVSKPGPEARRIPGPAPSLPVAPAPVIPGVPPNPPAQAFASSAVRMSPRHPHLTTARRAAAERRAAASRRPARAASHDSGSRQIQSAGLMSYSDTRMPAHAQPPAPEGMGHVSRVPAQPLAPSATPAPSPAGPASENAEVPAWASAGPRTAWQSGARLSAIPPAQPAGQVDAAQVGDDANWHPAVSRLRSTVASAGDSTARAPIAQPADAAFDGPAWHASDAGATGGTRHRDAVADAGSYRGARPRVSDDGFGGRASHGAGPRRAAAAPKAVASRRSAAERLMAAETDAAQLGRRPAPTGRPAPEQFGPQRSAAQQSTPQLSASQRRTTERRVTERPAAQRPATQSRPSSARYLHRLPPAVLHSFQTTARPQLLRAEPLYRDVADGHGIRWELLAACDWLQCRARPRYSPVHGEKLGTLNADGTCYRTRSEALDQCAYDLVELARTVYWIDLTAQRPLSIRDLANTFAAFRWGGLLRLHHTSAMEFPYSVAGLTEDHVSMRWPSIDEPNAPDRPGSRFRQPFGAVPILLGMNYPAIA